MCGIVGVASVGPVNEREWLAVGSASLGHRGPDDCGEWWSTDGRVGLGHRRLSILDLSDAGHQPMHDDHKSISITFNGEIYNFVELRQELQKFGISFRSGTDTEVVLGAYRVWGLDCLEHFNGTFAFGIYDDECKRLFLARDRAGEKPLFYWRDAQSVRFASELKAMLADDRIPRSIDPLALDCYLSMGYVPGSMCIVKGFSKLPPAHALTFDLNTEAVRVWEYWHPPEAPVVGPAGIDSEALLDELESLLEDSVRLQLVADVPVGVLLSGGVDSSLVTALASRLSQRVRTFTIRFPGHSDLDETEHARLIASHFGTDHTELIAEPASADLLPSLAWYFDEPINDSSMIPTSLVSRLVREQCTVALGGDGGDELFGGYGHYSRLIHLQRRIGNLPRPIRSLAARGAGHLLPVGFRGRSWAQGLSTDFTSGVPLIANYFDQRTRRELLEGAAALNFAAEGVHASRTPHDPDLLQRATRWDFANYLPEDILVKVDRSSMLASLEVRSPFLDYRVINFAFGKVPSTLKATSASKKILLKHLAGRVLPPEFNRDRKQGFSIPLASWLESGPFLDLFEEVLLDPNSIFSREAVESLLQGQRKGRANSERLFGLVFFELWRRRFNMSL